MGTWITKHAEKLGLKKVDARSPLRIEVTKREISTASKKDPSCCAFANATKRQHDIKAAYFFMSTAWVERGDGTLVRYRLPPSMQKEIVAFDRNKTMEPGDYQLVAFGKTSRMSAFKKRPSAKKRRAADRTPKTTRKQSVRHRTTNVRTLDMPASLAG